MSKYNCSVCGGWPLYGKGLCKRHYFQQYYQENKADYVRRAENNKESRLEWGRKYRAENREAYNAYRRMQYHRSKQ